MILLFLLCIVLGTFGAWLVIYLSPSMRLIDFPNARSSHCTPTPKGGGIGILSVFIISAIVTGISKAFWIPISALAILAFWGDRVELSPKLRLFCQLFLAMVLIVWMVPYSSDDRSWYLLWMIFGTVYIVGTANFYNFMDGINGIAGITGVTGFSLLAAYLSSYDEQAPRTIAICISLGCLGFLPLNIPKAKIFMGDIGSILLGSVFASLTLLFSKALLDFLCMSSFLFPIYADELITMFIRLKDGENLTHPHRRHIYQLLANEKGIPHWKVSVGFGLVQLVIGVSVILIKPHGVLPVFTFLILCFIIFVTVSLYLRSFLEKSPRPTSGN